MKVNIKGVDLPIKYNMAGLQALTEFGGDEGEATSTYRVVWGGIVGGLVGTNNYLINNEIVIGDERVTVDDVVDYVDELYLSDSTAILNDIRAALTESTAYKRMIEKKNQILE